MAMLPRAAAPLDHPPFALHDLEALALALTEAGLTVPDIVAVLRRYPKTLTTYAKEARPCKSMTS